MSNLNPSQQKNLAAAELLKAKILGLFLHIESVVAEIPGAELDIAPCSAPHQFREGIWVADPRPSYSCSPLRNRMDVGAVAWKSYRVRQAIPGSASFHIEVGVSKSNTPHVIVDWDRTSRPSKFPSITSAIQGAFQRLQAKNREASQKKSLEEQCMDAFAAQLPAIDEDGVFGTGKRMSLSVKGGIASGWAYLVTGPRVEFTFTPATGLRITEVSQDPRATALKEARDAAMVQARKDFSDAAIALLRVL